MPGDPTLAQLHGKRLVVSAGTIYDGAYTVVNAERCLDEPLLRLTLLPAEAHSADVQHGGDADPQRGEMEGS